MTILSGLTNLESAAQSNLHFQEYFRCPVDFSPFQIPASPLLSEPNFFSFEGATCYGRSIGHSEGPSNKLTPLEPIRQSRSRHVYLPFSPSEVIDNLRLESYLRVGPCEKFLSGFYYGMRPAIPKWLRRTVQRLVYQQRLRQFPAWPVDLSVENIFKALMKVALEAGEIRECPFIWFWPEGQSSAVMMTHDVEEENGANLCGMLMDLDDFFGIRSAFQVVPEARYSGAEELIRAIRQRGFEVNLHDLDHDGRLYSDEKRFRMRATRINDYARQFGMHGFRAGSMHRNQRWFHLLEFQYDMSVPNAGHLEPQRGGCCTVMPFFVGNILELPLTTLQDHALFYVLSEPQVAFWQRQIELINEHHGLISFIVHPDYLGSERERNLYRQLLTHLMTIRNERNLWFAVPGEINVWWRQRSRMRLVRRGWNWVVEGEGCHRARVAYARLEDGNLVYRVENSDISSAAEPHAQRVDADNGR